MRWLDYKVGTVLFLPWIIRFLQATRMSQYAFYRYIWMVLLLYMLSQCKFDGFWPWVWGLFIGAGGAYYVYAAGTHPDKPRPPSAVMRAIFLMFTVCDFVFPLLPNVSFEWTRYVIDFAVLAGEYALLIDKIPPLEKKAKKVKAASKRAAEQA